MPAPSLSKPQNITAWVLQIAVVAIFLPMLVGKYTGAEEAIYIFETVGIEPWGRFLTAAAETVAIVLLLTPRTAVFGAALSAVVIMGAIMSHLTSLGVTVTFPSGESDGGATFGMAIAILIASGVVLFIRRRSIPVIGAMLAAAQTARI
jgi:putative oxidoreductase